MFFRNLNIRVLGKPLQIGLIFLFTMLLAVPDLFAETFGVQSKNQNDRPPIMNPDVASRSTNPDRPPAYGPENAKVRIVIFSDYQCIHCRRASQATHQISAEFPGEVRIEVWQRPLAMHTKAEMGSRAAVAAQQQGKFWEMHDMIFASPSTMEVSDLERYAEELDLDMDKFKADMNSPAIAERVQQESAVAEALGALATPGFLINGKVYVGWGSWRSFRGKVERELKAANALADQGMEPAEIQSERAFENNNESTSLEIYRTAVLQSAPFVLEE